MTKQKKSLPKCDQYIVFIYDMVISLSSLQPSLILYVSEPTLFPCLDINIQIMGVKYSKMKKVENNKIHVLTEVYVSLFELVSEKIYVAS